MTAPATLMTSAGARLRLVHLDACPVCSSRQSAFAFASPDLLHGVPGLFAYERCAACGSFFLNPRVVDDDLLLCYPNDYFTHDPAVSAVASHGGLQGRVRQVVLGSARAGRRSLLERSCGRLLHGVRFVRRRAMFGLVDEVPVPLDPGRCVEIGPGAGDDLWRLAQIGWTASGIDLDPEAAGRASLRSGCPVQVVRSVLDHRPEVPYGLIYASHSLEHVPDLRATLAHLHSLLDAGGRLVLIVPNPSSISARLHGPHSVVWDPPRHLSLASPRALRALLVDNGFIDISVRTLPRRAAHYLAVARARRAGVTGSSAWGAPATRRDRLIHCFEAILARLGVDVGEEIVVTGTAGERR